ncbi:MAG: ABC transporter permease [Gemmatimonadaceae bacterium]|nr:ABC transporter permease [Gemmatimonadaceae bacterium]MCC6430513.1 ABC transporter permease [Gemmatimonadaceae bacterium]
MSLDLRYVLRSLSRAKGFAMAVVITLGLGIGANTAIFSAVRGVFLKPLPHADGDRLMYLRHYAANQGQTNVAFSVPEINDFRAQSRTMQQIAEYSPLTLSLIESADASQIDVGLVTGNYLSVMGLRPILGRAFTSADDGAGAPPVILLGHAYWMTHFSSDPKIVGQTMRIGKRTVQVIGVLEPAPFFPGRIDALMNMSISEHHVSAMMVQGRTHRMTEMIARLAPGSTVEQARQEIGMITQRMHTQYPEAYEKTAGYTVELTPFKEVLGRDAQLLLWMLMGVAALVLVIACANVANLTLMRGVRREHEMTVRAALGAGTSRLRKLLLAENLVLAGGGALFGLLVAFAGVGTLSRFIARFSPRADEIQVDWMVLAFTALLAVVIAFLLSFAPRVGNEQSLSAGLAAGSLKTSGSGRRKRLQQALVVTQVAVSVVLLSGAGLLVRSMQQLAAVDPGLNPKNVLTMEVPLDFTAVTDFAKAGQRYEEMQRALTTLPGVELVGLGSTIPLRASQILLEMKAEGRTTEDGPTPSAEYRTADPGYFRASGIPLLKGREFAAGDVPTSEKVVILNKTLADRLFPTSDPIGRRVAWTGDVLRFIGVSGDWRTVVGVMNNTKDGGLDAPPLPVAFLPVAQAEFPPGGLVIRSAVDPNGLSTAARAIVRSIAPDQPIENVMSLEAVRDESVGPRRLNALLLGGFGILALVIASIGIAAVLAFNVSARTNEIGIRMALGAAPSRVTAMILKEGGLLVGLGLAIGVAGSLALSRSIEGLLFGVTARDPFTLLAVAGTMIAIGLVACWVPAARASRIDPSEALRSN